MPTCSPPWVRLSRLLPAFLLLASTCTLPAQVLVRPGWKGSGLTADPWWKHAIFYDLDPNPDNPPDPSLKSLSVRLEALRSLNVDALILPAPQLPAPGSNAAMPDLDPFDALLREASRHGIRVLLTLQPPTGSHDLSGLARFWLNRGVAGLHIASPSAASPSEASPAATSPAPANPDGLQDLVQSVRKQEEGALGQRILISDTGLAEQESDALPAHPSARRQSAAHSPAATQLQIDTQASRLADPAAATLRPLLAASLTRPGLLLDLRAPGTANGRPLANSFAAIALTTHPAALIDDAANLVLQPTPEHVEQPDEPAKPIPPPPPPPPPGTYLPYVPYVPPAKPATVAAPKPPPPDPLTTWYGKLAALHHDSAVLRNGTTTFLDFDAQNTLVWVTRLPSQSPLTPPVVVVCNLSDAPVRLSLAAAMTKLNLHGAFLRTLLRTDTAMGGQDLDSVNVPAFAVYIGELRR